MELSGEKLLNLRIRDRVIRLFEIHADVGCAVEMGAFDMLEVIHYLLPIDYRKAKAAFTAEEMGATQAFLELAEAAAEATTLDGWTRQQFLESPEWCALRDCAQSALDIFNKRGRFFEGYEKELLESGPSAPIDTLGSFAITPPRQP